MRFFETTVSTAAVAATLLATSAVAAPAAKAASTTVKAAASTTTSAAALSSSQIALDEWYDQPHCFRISGNGMALGYFITLPQWQTPYSYSTARNDIRGSLSGNSACNTYTFFESGAVGVHNTTTGASFLASDFCTEYQVTKVIKATTGNKQDTPCVAYDASVDGGPDAGNLAFDAYGDGSDDPGADGIEKRTTQVSGALSKLVGKAGQSVAAPETPSLESVKNLIPASHYKANMTHAEIVQALSG